MVDAEAGPVEGHPQNNNSKSLHLVVLQHGLWGQPADLGFLQQLLSANTQGQDGTQIGILNSGESSGRLTYDGIDTCAGRLLVHVKAEIERQQGEEGKRVTHLSFIGYSLGRRICGYQKVAFWSPSTCVLLGRAQDGVYSASACTLCGLATRYRIHVIVWTMMFSKWLGKKGFVKYSAALGT
jgi:hypothetical protein